MKEIMEKMLTFIEINLNLYFLLVIVLGGYLAIKYTRDLIKIKDRYKVFFASIIVSIIFYAFNDCKTECFPQYFFTYLFATSFYELLIKIIKERVTPKK